VVAATVYLATTAAITLRAALIVVVLAVVAFVVLRRRRSQFSAQSSGERFSFRNLEATPRIELGMEVLQFVAGLSSQCN
jgi:hypothetical protein